MDTSDPVLKQALGRLRAGGWDDHDPALVLLGTRQRLYRLTARELLGEWIVSTGLRGFGNRADSGCTPTGVHRISDRIGHGAALGTVFKGRQPTGEIVAAGAGEGRDLITTRILWLDGLEPGINRGPGIDTRSRYIYIHGTPHTSLLGQAVSAGCVRMADAAVADLFDQVRVGTKMVIVETGHNETR
ncbi:MAG: L,D-transpeptidase [Magnetococcales bacterium]|nr:L,D-transpeptidase [Magnetococcales bacterium]